MELREDVVYHETPHGNQKLDLYLPVPRTSNRGSIAYPTVVYAHGGGFAYGNKKQFRRYATYMAERGYLGAAINYRLLGDVEGSGVYPLPIRDGKAAVKWLRTHADEYDVDAEKVGFVGGSAGGNMAALVATTANEEPFVPEGFDASVSSRVQAAVGFYGIYNFVRHSSPLTVGYFGGTIGDVPDDQIDGSPITHITPDDPPHLLIHGTADAKVAYSQSVSYREALNDQGIFAKVYTVEGARHGFVGNDRRFEPTAEAMEKFLKAKLSPSFGN